MSMRTRTDPAPAPAEAWGRRRLLAALAGLLAATVTLFAGLGYAVYLTLSPAPAGPLVVAGPANGAAVGAGVTQTQQRRDAIAAEPMMSVGTQAALPAPPSTRSAPGITIPPSTASGPGGVPTGFPRTPEGAVAQLAAIETTVFQAMSIPLTAEIHDHWTLPVPSGTGAKDGSSDGAADKAGVIELDLDDSTSLDSEGLGSPGIGSAAVGSRDGDAPDTPGVGGWEIARHVQSFLGTAQMGPEKDITTTVTATPAAGLVKGRDGPDWVLACVLLEVRAVITTEARIGFGHCERMQWHDDRWLIAPGTPPARAPSTWPGTQQSIDAGWRTWTDNDPTPDDAVREQTAREDLLLDVGETGEG